MMLLHLSEDNFSSNFFFFLLLLTKAAGLYCYGFVGQTARIVVDTTSDMVSSTHIKVVQQLSFHRFVLKPTIA